MLRAAGFKVVLHWMPNLLGATPQSDLADFTKLWDDPALQPDEIKIYPCSLLANADLYAYWQRGEYHPYSDATLVELVAACKQLVPRYCRINRVYRDIPAPNIVAGSTCSNLREVVQRKMRADGQRCLPALPRGARQHRRRRGANAGQPRVSSLRKHRALSLHQYFR